MPYINLDSQHLQLRIALATPPARLTTRAFNSCGMAMPSNPSSFNDLQWSRIVRALSLTPREQEIVAELLQHAWSEKALAKRLEISRHTVHEHLRHLYSKAGVRTKPELIVRIFALANNAPNERATRRDSG